LEGDGEVFAGQAAVVLTGSLEGGGDGHFGSELADQGEV
jgi:hypothetical protein